eukprot:9364705-Alexandrium_andersonii.AAC.1
MAPPARQRCQMGVLTDGPWGRSPPCPSGRLTSGQPPGCPLVRHAYTLTRMRLTATATATTHVLVVCLQGFASTD